MNEPEEANRRKYRVRSKEDRKRFEKKLRELKSGQRKKLTLQDRRMRKTFKRKLQNQKKLYKIQIVELRELYQVHKVLYYNQKVLYHNQRIATQAALEAKDSRIMELEQTLKFQEGLMSPEQKQIGFEKLPEPEKELEIVDTKLPEPEKELEIVETRLPEQEGHPKDGIVDLQALIAHGKENIADGGVEKQYEIVKNQSFEQGEHGEGQKVQNAFAISDQESVIHKFRQNRFLSVATFASIAVAAVIGIFFLVRG
ncbi:MAG TPA: hypothetical protein VJ246_00590 [Patescibacteria group bacterium]|nr:hypothetical protein [Patescibacteria group bacterium]